ncbi:DUF2461 domain-containing protein [Luteococcus sp. Sow4_B9]|uniref:DUF2461 domain-containing protein n=1 Tax=Luteococcus sp. Sow4_B9 TaxID=3438792 RepID=UPI003F9A105C
MAFTGIPLEAVDFYRQLEVNNNREWWLAHKDDYDRLVRTPMLALAEQVGPAFGETKVFRPYRQVRFSNDKTPYKAHQGLYAHSHTHAGWYFQVDSTGFHLAGGNYFMDGPQLARYREAVQNDATGVQLQEITAELESAGYLIDGDRLATRPRGVAPDAPRLELLRHKTISARLDLGQPAWMATAEAAEYLNDGWDELRDLMAWLTQYVGNSDVSGPRAR